MRFIFPFTLFLLSLFTLVAGYLSRGTQSTFLKEIYLVLLAITSTSYFLVFLCTKKNIKPEKEETDTDTSQDEC